MNLRFEYAVLGKSKADVSAIFVRQGASALASDMRAIRRKLGSQIPAYEAGDFHGKTDESTLVYVRRRGTVRRFIIVGLGKEQRFSPEPYRRAGATAAKLARSLHAKSLALFVPRTARQIGECASALAEGAYLSLYRFDKYVSRDENTSPDPDFLTLCSENSSHIRIGKKAIHRISIVCEATVLARNLGNAPGSEINPVTLADAARASATRSGYSVSVLGRSEIEELGMGGVIGVSQGSNHPPQFIILEYNNSPKRPVVLVGKGVTFDSGGISIKPSAGMAEMKMDMSGAAAVIGTFEAVARLRLRIHLIGLIPAVENMPGGGALRPGDILRHFNGKTSEVVDTDAEGRLILADALAYAEKYKPAALIDLATLTGAVVVALGHEATGMIGNDDSLMKKLRLAGDAVYERVWQLPFFDEYEKLVKSEVADVKNLGGRWGGAITAAMFLKRFVTSRHWAHLDIAGTAMLEENSSYTPKGASGVGVRLLTEFLTRWK